MIVTACIVGALAAGAVGYCAWEWERLSVLIKSRLRARRRRGWLL